MKKLSNVSPFLLLLFPVFIIMLFAFNMSNTSAQNEEAALKTTTSVTNVVVKATVKILK